jgi:hypothetical protein
LTASIPLCVTQLMALKLFSLEKEKSTYWHNQKSEHWIDWKVIEI